MSRLTVLHYVTQWLWLSDSFVHGPIAASRHDVVAVSRMPVVNRHVYPPPARLLTWAGEPPDEGPDLAADVVARLDVRPDVVHVHHGYGLPDGAALAAALDVPLVVSFWGYDVTALPAREPTRLAAHLDAPALVRVPSRFLAGRVAALGVDEGRIRVVPGSVDLPFFDPTPLPAEPRVAFVGRFVAKKGIDLLLEVWPAVRRAVPGATLVLLGYGDDAPTPDPALGIRVEAPDPVDPRRQVLDLIRWCRVYVSPSRTGPDGDSESQHIGNLEAQAAGRVVLTTDHAAIPEFVADGHTGVVVPEGDPRALAAALVELLQDPHRGPALARGAAVAARRFAVAAIGRDLDRLYTEVAGRAGRPRTPTGGTP